MLFGPVLSRVAATAVVAIAVCGCEERILATSPVLDLGSCQMTECDAPTIAPTALTLSQTTCDPGVPEPLLAAWSQRVPDPVACDALGTCSLSHFRIAVSPDGSLWVLAQALSPPQADREDENTAAGGLWLGHFSSTGVPLRAQLIDVEAGLGGLEYQFSLTTDSKRHLFVAVLKYATRWTRAASSRRQVTDASGWLAEFAPDGEPIGQRLLVRGVAGPERMALWSAGNEVIALGRFGLDDGSIALLDTSARTLRWSQTRPSRSRFESLVSDAHGQVSLLVTAPPPSDVHSGMQAIEHYDAHGRLAWEMAQDLPTDWPSNQGFSIDATGNLIQVNYSADEQGEEVHVLRVLPGTAEGAMTRIQAFAPEGGNPYNWDPAFGTTVDRNGVVFHPGGVYQFFGQAASPAGDAAEAGRANPTVYQQILYEIASDGATCRARARRDAALEPWHQLAIGSDGELYFASDAEYGQFQR